MFIEILKPVLVLFALALVFAIALAYLGKKLEVTRDERIDMVVEKLSGANCGGCGYAGCDGFATALVEGTAKLSDCCATSKKNKELIAEILGVENSGEATKVVVCCRGGNNAKDKYDYMGYGDCRSMELLAGGRKQCQWGCLGMGSCVDACVGHAIEVNMKGYSEVNQNKCIACGRCISVCPKKIIKRIPASAKVYVACSNHQKGKEVKELCSKGCIACGLCVRACEFGAITIVDNLAVIDYTKCTGCGKCAAKCPQHCIMSAVDKQ
jgi:Predicted NADH:ubiquinone oxidoreductase, subunit RnfB